MLPNSSPVAKLKLARVLSSTTAYTIVPWYTKHHKSSVLRKSKSIPPPPQKKKKKKKKTSHSSFSYNSVNLGGETRRNQVSLTARGEAADEL